MKKMTCFLILMMALSGCSGEPQTKEVSPKEIDRTVQQPGFSFDSAGQPTITKNLAPFDFIYQEVCWTDCTEEEPFTHQLHSGQAQKGDVIEVRWDGMTPPPDKVEVTEREDGSSHADEGKVLSDGQQNFSFEVADESFNKTYELVFTWQETAKVMGKSRLAFRIEK